MSDWRWVTEVKATPSPGGWLPPAINGMWINFSMLDQIMPLPAGRYSGARTRLGWFTHNGWIYIFVAEQIDPNKPLPGPGEQQPTTHERTTHADSAMEPTDPT